MRQLKFVGLVFLFAEALQINAEFQVQQINGRLLTPQEGCGHSKVPTMNRIVGGGPAKIGAWPWMALLGYGYISLPSFDCGGSLITSRHVLTAAHCVKRPYKLVCVRLGEHDLSRVTDGPHEDVPVKRGVAHRVYDEQLGLNDIGMVYLKHDVHFTHRITPICLPIAKHLKDRDFVGKNPYVAGWGDTEENGTMSDILMQVQITVISNSDCQRKYRKVDKSVDFFQFTERVLCAGHAIGGKDACQGDSGGPLMMPVYNKTVSYYQIGVISYGHGCGREGIPGIYANVVNYLDWIDWQLEE